MLVHELSAGSALGHDQEAVAFGNHVLDLWQLMAAKHDEAVRFRLNAQELMWRQPNLLHARVVSALAGEVHLSSGIAELLAGFHDLVIDRAKQHLILRGSQLPLRILHEAPFNLDAG